MSSIYGDISKISITPWPCLIGSLVQHVDVPSISCTVHMAMGHSSMPAFCQIASRQATTLTIMIFSFVTISCFRQHYTRSYLISDC